MKKIELIILGIEDSEETWILSLKEKNGKRVFTATIDEMPAESIIAELDNMEEEYPTAYELIEDIFEATNSKINYIVISDIADEAFYSNIYWSCAGSELESVLSTNMETAIVLALKAKCKIYILPEVLDQVGYVDYNKAKSFAEIKPLTEEERLMELSIEDLNAESDAAIEEEDYLKAGLIRDVKEKRNIQQQ